MEVFRFLNVPPSRKTLLFRNGSQSHCSRFLQREKCQLVLICGTARSVDSYVSTAANMFLMTLQKHTLQKTKILPEFYQNQNSSCVPAANATKLL